MMVETVVIGVPASLAALAAGNGLLYQEEWARRLAIGGGLYRCVMNLVATAMVGLWQPLAEFTSEHQFGPVFSVVRGLVRWLFWLWALNLLSLPATVERFAKAAEQPRRHRPD